MALEPVAVRPDAYVGNDVGRDQLLGFFRPVGIEKLNDRLDLLELNEIAIMHGHTRFLSTYFK